MSGAMGEKEKKKGMESKNGSGHRALKVYWEDSGFTVSKVGNSHKISAEEINDFSVVSKHPSNCYVENRASEQKQGICRKLA